MTKQKLAQTANDVIVQAVLRVILRVLLARESQKEPYDIGKLALVETLAL